MKGCSAIKTKMAMDDKHHHSQKKSSRLDESLGMRRGKESKKKQSYKDRRDESRRDR